MRGGIGLASHVHNVDEWFFVLEGSMDMQGDDRGLTATAGDSIWIPRGTDHGSEDVLTRMTNNYWSASSDSGWSKIAPAR